MHLTSRHLSSEFYVLHRKFGNKIGNNNNFKKKSDDFFDKFFLEMELEKFSLI
jgi:hypothetical protein